jgi:hypothetical protein
MVCLKLESNPQKDAVTFFSFPNYFFEFEFYF